MGNPTLRRRAAGRTRSRRPRSACTPSHRPGSASTTSSGGRWIGRLAAAAVHPHDHAVGRQHPVDLGGEQEAVDEDDGVGRAVARSGGARRRPARGARRRPARAAASRATPRSASTDAHALGERRRVGADPAAELDAHVAAALADAALERVGDDRVASGAGARVPLGRQAVEEGRDLRPGLVVPRLAGEARRRCRVMIRIGWSGEPSPEDLCPGISIAGSSVSVPGIRRRWRGARRPRRSSGTGGRSWSARRRRPAA